MPLENVEAPMAGRILQVMVEAGAKVNEGDLICTIESMKMENPIFAPLSGIIKEIKVSPQQVVRAGATIAVIEY